MLGDAIGVCSHQGVKLSAVWPLLGCMLYQTADSAESCMQFRRLKLHDKLSLNSRGAALHQSGRTIMNLP